jgi:nucleotide sugar dehydrogenase|tara:strand:+ start:425 stop:1759 length:1335 start_codon:yes stop_codon:yes gene_type:complete
MGSKMNHGEVTGDETICVVGLGYVGLPTAIAFHSAGFRVIGVDVSETVVEGLNNGVSPLIDSSSRISIPLDSDKWFVTGDFEKAVPDSDVVLITVPTPVNTDNSPDLSYVKSAAKSVLENLDRSKSTAVVLESTVYPGVTRKILGEESNKLGLTDEVVTLAYCPERVNPGDFERGIESVAQIVGCDDSRKGGYLADLFGKITQESSTYVGKIEVAEASKLIENVQRDIDIALANELAMVLPRIGVDVEEVLSAASTKWNFHRHTPGIGVGGHCIPVDPYYYIELSEGAGFPSLLASSSREINNSMPKNSANQILSILGEVEKPKVLILGYSYKANVGDTRETPVEPLASHLKEGGCEVLIHDPLVDVRDLPSWVESVSEPTKCDDLDLIILATFHGEYNFNNELWKSMFSQMKVARVYDGRRVLPKDEMISYGWEYYGVGNPNS